MCPTQKNAQRDIRMTEFDMQTFEDQVEKLLLAHRRLAVENQALMQEFETLTRKNAQMRKRLQAIVERIAALEKEAEHQQA